MKIPTTEYNTDDLNPKFIRLPKSGMLCPYTGLSRTFLNELILPSEKNNFSPPVKSISLKKKHHLRGVRLIHFENLVEYLNSFSRKGGDL